MNLSLQNTSLNPSGPFHARDDWWHTCMREDADGRAQRSERGRCKLWEQHPGICGLPGPGHSPSWHFWHLQWQRPPTATCWLGKSAQEGKEEAMLGGDWVLTPMICQIPTRSGTTPSLCHHTCAQYSRIFFCSNLILSQRLYKMHMLFPFSCIRKLKLIDITCATTKFSNLVSGGYGLEAWSPFIKSRALSGAQGCVPVTQKVLSTFLGAVGWQKAWRQHPWPWIHYNFIGGQR